MPVNKGYITIFAKNGFGVLEKIEPSFFISLFSKAGRSLKIT
jgi:hypothetical protein